MKGIYNQKNDLFDPNKSNNHNQMEILLHKLSKENKPMARILNSSNLFTSLYFQDRL